MRATLCERLGRDDIPDAITLQHAVSDALRAAAETYFMQSSELEAAADAHVGRRGLPRAGPRCSPESVLREITPPLFATEIDSLICHEGTRDAIGGSRRARLSARLRHEHARRHGDDPRSCCGATASSGLMRRVVVSSEEGWRKPHPSLFEKAAARARRRARRSPSSSATARGTTSPARRRSACGPC